MLDIITGVALLSTITASPQVPLLPNTMEAGKPLESYTIPAELVQPIVIPEIKPLEAVQPIEAPKPRPAAKRASVSSYESVGTNTYEPGQCTWYVKNRRPDLPNSLGNADTWADRARALGYVVSSAPIAGAAAQTIGGMHVVYVESVNGDGTITISEMNYDYVPYHTRTVVVQPSKYLFIY